MNIDEVLRSFGVDIEYEDLVPDEKTSLHNMLSSISQNQMTLERFKEYLQAMRGTIIQELTSYNLSEKQDLFLKARLKNYELMIDFLTSPERAKQALERQLRQVKK